MNNDTLRRIVALGPNQHVEFMSDSLRLEAIGATVCGFLNSGGGVIVFGAAKTATVKGVSDAEQMAHEIEAYLQTFIAPHSPVWISSQKVEEAVLLLVEVPAGKDIPYAFRNVVYLREGENTPQASIATIRDMILSREVEPERWERRLSVCALDNEVDLNDFEMAVENMQESRQYPISRDANPAAVLGELSLAQFGRLTNGGVALFGKQPAHYFPQLRVRAGCFEEDQTSDKYRDMKTLEGPLVSVWNQTVDFVVRNTPTVSRFSRGNLRRRDESLYPLNVLREALINAFAHRDYSDSSGGIAVHIYPRRLEIWNSGAFPSGISAEVLSKPHHSVLRNPDIAQVLYLRGVMEKAGRGSLLMINECRSCGLPDPEWDSDDSRGVILTLRIPEVILEVTQRRTQEGTRVVTQEVTLEVNTEVNPGDKRGVAPEDAQEVAPEVRLVRVLKGEMTRQKLQEALQLSDPEHFRKHYLLAAIKAGYVEMTIPDKPNSRMQRYRLTETGKKFKARSRSRK